MSNSASANSASAEQKNARPSQELYKPPVLRISRKKSIPDKKSTTTEKGSPSACLLPEQKADIAAPRQCRPPPMQVVQPIPLQNQIIIETNFVPKPIVEEAEFEELAAELKRMLKGTESSKMGEYITVHAQSASNRFHIGQFLVKQAIEGNRQKQSRKGALSRCFSQFVGDEAFLDGMVLALERYFECRAALRETEEHFGIWVNFVSLTFELGQLARGNGRIAELVFPIFEFLFTEPTVKSLQIVELECALSLMLILGRNLERDFPAQVASLRDTIRDAFLFSIGETWARKMVLLMVEFGANGWKLSEELEECYFH